MHPHLGIQVESTTGGNVTSLHSLFDSTRQILREAGPHVGASITSVGGIAIAVLNRGIRPFLFRWHLALSDWESHRTPGLSPGEHERKWLERDRFRSELAKLRVDLELYAEGLAEIAGVTIR